METIFTVINNELGAVEIGKPNAKALKHILRKAHHLDIASCKMLKNSLSIVVAKSDVDRAIRVFNSINMCDSRGNKIGKHHHQPARVGYRQFQYLYVNKTAMQ